MEKKVYLDHSATTPLDSDVFEVMKPYFTEKFGNASSVHNFGQEARMAVEQSRKTIAKLINAQPAEIYFVSGGTEANNLAIKGFAYQNRTQGNHIITSPVEHDAVLNTCKALEEQGFEITYLPVDKYGMVNPDDIKSSIKPETILISMIHGNNEIGTINPISEIGKIAKDAGIYFHTDTVQSFGKVPIDVDLMSISLLSISGHKIYGPKGIGALYIRNGTKIKNLFHGGRQERNLRSGTENVPGIVGIAKAAELMYQSMRQSQVSIGSLRDYFESELTKRFVDVKINGHSKERLYNNLNVIFKGVDNENMLLQLNAKGIAASNGSACNSGTIEPSHVLQAMGLPKEQINSAIRFSLGKSNTKKDIDYTISIIKNFMK